MTTSSSDGGDGGDDERATRAMATSVRASARSSAASAWSAMATRVSIAEETGLEGDQLGTNLDRPAGPEPGEKVSLIEPTSDGTTSSSAGRGG